MNNIGIKAFSAVCEAFKTFSQCTPVETAACRSFTTGSKNPQLNFIFDVDFEKIAHLSKDLNTLNQTGFPHLVLCNEAQTTHFSEFFTQHGFSHIGTAQTKTQSLNDANIPTPDHIDIVEVSTPEQMHIWRSIAARNFDYTTEDDKALFEHFLTPGAHRETIKLYLAYVNNTPAGQSMLVLADGFAANMWSSVVPEARRQGVLTKMISHRNAVAHRKGYSLSVVQCMPMSATVYDKLGYANADTLSLYVSAAHS